MRLRICDKISKFGLSSTTTGRPGFLGGFTFSMQFTVAVRDRFSKIRAVLTRNRNVSFELAPLGIGKEEHHPLAVLAAENAKVLRDTLLPSTLGLGLGHAAEKN